MKNIKKTIVFILFSFLKLIFFYNSTRNLKKIIDSQLSFNTNILSRIKYKLYLPDISNYIFSKDVMLTSKYGDPFINHTIIPKYLEEFKQIIKTEKYAPAGMINTALLVLYCLIRHSKPDVFIESGSKYGYSSTFIAKAIEKNNNKGKLVCLSIFNNDEKKIFLNKMNKYQFLEVIEGNSEINIRKLRNDYSNKKVAFLIDGPKARSKNWNELNQNIIEIFKNIDFICFDSAQEHLPFSLYKENWNYKRSINFERLQISNLFLENYKSKQYKICFQSNQFCREYMYLNQNVFNERNKKKYKEEPWKEYNFDKINDHIAICYKLGIIYKSNLI